MKLPIPFLLYAVALGLFGFAGWVFYGMLPMWKEASRTEASDRGRTVSQRLFDKGRGQGVVTAEWQYTRAAAPWWATFKDVNLIGKLPPAPVEPEKEKEEVKVVVNLQPLEEIIELIALVHNEPEADKPGDSYVIVRYRPTANVAPPEWWTLENTPVAAAGATAPIGRDSVPAAAPGRSPRPQPSPTRGGKNGQPMPSALPTSLTGREILQTVYVRDIDERHGSRLWPEYSHIRLVGVSPNAQSAWFVRDIPPAKEGEVPPPAVKEELFKTSANLSQDVKRALAEMQGKSVESVRSPAGAAATNAWREVEETVREGNTFLIGRKDERRFQDVNDDFFDRLDVDVYVSRESKTRGLIIRNVDSQLATKFGVQAGDVLLEVNGQRVESKAQAVQLGKKQYQRGVRTFVTQWMSNGSIVERTYQAPTK